MAPQFAAAGFLTGLLALATFASCNTEGDILYKQRLAWEDPNNVLQSWNSTLANPCTWFHVTCNNNNFVIRVDLGNAGISGPLLPDLAEIQNLQYIELYGNGLNGSIPETLGNLTNLISLDLWDNLLTGEIPTTLGSVSTLRYLRLYQNNLTGPIPSSFGNLTSLLESKLQENSLSGAIPASLGNIKALQFSRLNDNMLTGTVPSKSFPLSTFGNLTELNTDRNNLDGTRTSSGLRVTAIIQDALKTA
uniref:Leucine-rich repeat-containing extracellular glycoprotein n=1 Tax=Sorghum bicolor TaxID=4558 RepID=P93529_SORBI|nr:leucine-rich repeat-containing extracellular glycoprotein; contains six N-glycosylation sites [NX(S/T)] [Sorghum bicolor]